MAGVLGGGWFRALLGAAVTSAERTAYPIFPKMVLARDLHVFFTPSPGMSSVNKLVEEGGGFEGQLKDIEEVMLYKGDNHELLIAEFFKSDRSTMFALATALEFEATSEDRRVLDALDHALAHWSGRREFIPDHSGGVPLDLSFVSVNWRRAIRDRKHPGMLVKRHFEAMCFAYLAEELRTGDVAVTGGADYGDWSQHLLTFEECRPLLKAFCEEAGLPDDPDAFVAELKDRHARAAADLDAGYNDNEDLTFDSDGRPTLKKTKGKGTSAEAARLGEEIRKRLPERTLIEILARTAYWLGWWRHFGPASGKDPKLKDPQGRYVLTTFACGSNMGPAEAARHIAGITAHEISLAKNRHVTLAKLNKAIAEVVNAFTRLDVVKAWGDGKSVATDGTQVDTYIDNLLAESPSVMGALVALRTTMCRIAILRSFPGSFPVGRGRRSTSSTGCWPTPPSSSPRPSMPIRKASRSRSSRWRTCSGST